MSMQPNLTPYTHDEVYQLLIKARKLEEDGRIDEAKHLKRRTIPVIPQTANYLKNEFGINFLIESEFNLSLAVKEYGEKWLEEN